MKFHSTKFKDVWLIDAEIHEDERGYFGRFFCKEEFAKQGIDFEIKQINRSLTQKKGTIRGMHFQKLPMEEAKVVECLKGVVFDVIVDLRKNSETFGQWESFELREKKNSILFIPKGFAHGFQTLTDNCEMLYLMGEFYSPQHASGMRYDDPFLSKNGAISWPIVPPTGLSEKDEKWPAYVIQQ